MATTGVSWTTSEAHEDNPKAVFFGREEKLITPIALHFAKHHVELYAGKALSDAFFGNYFIYVGSEVEVKDFLEKTGDNLPPTLLLLAEISDFAAWDKLTTQFKRLKLVNLHRARALSTETAGEIIAFFLGSNQSRLDLPGPPDLSREEKIAEKPPQPGQAEKTEKDDESTQKIMGLFAVERPKQTRVTNSRGKFSLLASAVATLLIFLVFPVLAFFAETGLAGAFLYLGQRKIDRGDLVTARKHFASAKFNLELAQQTANFLLPLGAYIGQKELGHEVLQILDLGEDAASGVIELLTTTEKGELLLGAISGRSKGVAFSSVIAELKGRLTVADTELALFEAEAKTGQVANLLDRPFLNQFKAKFLAATERISTLRQEITMLKSGLTVLPEMIGLEAKRKYLVVFQNNMELRPTGGFIGSFGLATFENGQLAEFTVEDVYAADGSLRGHVDPPLPLTTVLGAEHWYMRDANWDPDFDQSGAQLRWFLEKELDISVDGVVAVDVTFAQKLLSAIGPVKIATQSEEITAENLYLTLQSDVHEDFFPGSTKKRDTLGELGRALILKLLEDKVTSWPKLVSILTESTEEKHLLVHFADPQLQKRATEFGWSGAIGQLPRCSALSCIQDYLLVVDANLGVNKTNFFVKREVSDAATFTDKELTHTLEIRYRNGATQNDKLGGTYKNYVRVYLTPDNELISAKVNNIPLTLSDAPVASSSAVTRDTEDGLKVFATLLEILPQAEDVLTLTYNRPVNLSQNTEYAYLVQKQPGTEADPYRLQLNLPSGRQVLPKTIFSGEVAGATSLAKEGEVTYNTTLLTDQKFVLTLNL